MKFLNVSILIVSLLLFCACNDNDTDKEEENEETIDMEWNKDFPLEANTLLYLDEEGEEHLIDIDAPYAYSEGEYWDFEYLENVKIGDERFTIYWRNADWNGMTEINKGWKNRGYEDGVRVDYNCNVNIIEGSKGEWYKNVVAPGHDEMLREVSIKAVFHVKKGYSWSDTIYSTPEKYIEAKGVFNFTGLQKMVTILGGL